MCLAIPMRIIKCDADTARVDCAGTTLDVSTTFIENPQVGDYVLVHAGFAIQKIDEAQARETAELLNKMALVAKSEAAAEKLEQK